jgi:hypothetical protein
MSIFQEKALAEKNMRDMLAQREQTEKHVRQLSYRSPGRMYFLHHFLTLFLPQLVAHIVDTEIS